MKIAIESNDGINLNSPFTHPKRYLVCEVNERGIKNSEFRNRVEAKHQPNLNDCGTIISRGMDRDNFHELKKMGLDVLITFKSSVNDAIHVFMKENILEQNVIH
jgi:predicted Fe-Mo cluster-binding NifX family protein